MSVIPNDSPHRMSSGTHYLLGKLVEMTQSVFALNVYTMPHLHANSNLRQIFVFC